jgi:hypothetical protein
MKTHPSLNFPMNFARIARAFLLAGGALLLVACGRETPPDDAVSQAPASSLLLADPPASAPGLLEAIEHTPPGEPLLFAGRVGGLRDPLSPDFALFVVADESVHFCDEGGDDDHCATPWDACCEDPEKVARSRVVVQFVDPAGEPLAVDLGATYGLAANDQVVVRGRLAPDEGSGNRVVIAEGMAILR